MRSYELLLPSGKKILGSAEDICQKVCAKLGYDRMGRILYDLKSEEAVEASLIDGVPIPCGKGFVLRQR